MEFSLGFTSVVVSNCQQYRPRVSSCQLPNVKCYGYISQLATMDMLRYTAEEARGENMKARLTKEELRILGERMRAAAGQAGLSAAKIGREIGVSRGAVDRWWNGEREPGGSYIIAYAKAVGKPVEWFTDGPKAEYDRLLGVTRAFLDMTAAGGSLEGTVDQLSGSVPLLDADKKHKLVAISSNELMDRLAILAGDRWDLLSEEEKQRVTARIVAQAFPSLKVQDLP